MSYFTSLPPHAGPPWHVISSLGSCSSLRRDGQTAQEEAFHRSSFFLSLLPQRHPLQQVIPLEIISNNLFSLEGLMVY